MCIKADMGYNVKVSQLPYTKISNKRMEPYHLNWQWINETSILGIAQFASIN